MRCQTNRERSNNIYEIDYLDGDVPDDEVFYSQIFQRCKDWLDNLLEHNQFFMEPPTNIRDFSTNDYAINNLWMIQTVISQDTNYRLILQTMNMENALSRQIVEVAFNRNQWKNLNDQNMNEVDNSDRYYLLFRAAWIDLWQGEVSDRFYQWLVLQPIWDEFTMGYLETLDFTELFPLTVDMLYFLSNLSFFYDQVAYDTGAKMSSFVQHTHIIQQFQSLHNPAQTNRIKMDYLRLYKADLLFAMRYVCFLAVSLQREEIPEEDEWWQIIRFKTFFSG